MTDYALDLFAGAGGWSVAADELGIAEMGVENLPEALLTRSANGFKSHEISNVWQFPFRDYRGGYQGKMASPPCQTFSTAGNGAGRKALDQVLGLIRSGAWKSLEELRAAALQLGDERTALVLTPLHAAYALETDWVAWEQVPTVLPVWQACAEVLRELGYSVWTGNLQAEQYGVPQTRKRAILIANRHREVGMPTPTHSRYYSRQPSKLDPGVQKWVSMREALMAQGMWPPPGNVLRSNYGTGGDPAARGERTTEEPAATVTSKIDRNKWVYRANKMPNGAWRDEEPAAPTVAFGHDAASVKWFYRGSNQAHAAKQELDTPAPTVMFGQRSNKVEWMPEDAVDTPSADGVRVTVAEAGVLQSFPANFSWQGGQGKQYLQVGNAIPPVLAKAVLREATGP